MPSERERNKALVLQMYDEAWNKGNLEFIKAVVSTTFQDHPPASPFQLPTKGTEAVSEAVKVFRKAMPDYHDQMINVVTEENRVVYLSRITGTHTGPFMQFPASNNKVSVMSINDYRLEDGKIVERWAIFDVVGMMQQMGIMPGGH